MQKLCVAHLVRAQNGPAPFAAFLDSYRRYSAGTSHDLVVIFKGFDTDASLAPYRAMLAGTSYQSIEVSDEGFDIGPYRQAAARYDYLYFCFVNSFSTIIADQWLEKLRLAVATPGVGLAGATGSWESHFTNHVKAWWRERSWRGNPDALASNLRQLKAAVGHWKEYPSFPNPHVRTNAFCIRRDHFLGIASGLTLQTKHQAYAFESGRRGLTRSMARLGLKSVVVGADGVAFAGEAWPKSRTFRAHGQTNLLVGDNQTNYYKCANPQEQQKLRCQAWGSIDLD